DALPIFSERVSEVSPGANAITATVWEEAVVPETPVSPDPLLNGLVALALGLLLGLGLAFLLEYLDDSWESPEEVERVSGVPVFGVIPGFRVEAGGKKGGR
ncbi:MAG: capsular biosynthesis protein, partial [Rubrobacter sp.]|nr:capsular biosynthesis protein [Rubrobacter sp.]